MSDDGEYKRTREMDLSAEAILGEVLDRTKTIEVQVVDMRRQSREQYEEIVGRISQVEGRQDASEKSHEKLVDNYFAMLERVRRVEHDRDEMRRTVTDSLNRQSDAMSGAMREFGNIYKRLDAQDNEARETKTILAATATETKTQTAKLDVLLAAAHDSAVVEAWKKRQIDRLILTGKAIGALLVFGTAFKLALMFIAWYAKAHGAG